MHGTLGVEVCSTGTPGRNDVLSIRDTAYRRTLSLGSVLALLVSYSLAGERSGTRMDEVTGSGACRCGCCTVQFSRSVVSDSLRPHESQHARPPCPSPTPGVYSNSCPSSR